MGRWYWPVEVQQLSLIGIQKLDNPKATHDAATVQYCTLARIKEK
jgi:hypothetical protein